MRQADTGRASLGAWDAEIRPDPCDLEAMSLSVKAQNIWIGAARREARRRVWRQIIGFWLILLSMWLGFLWTTS